MQNPFTAQTQLSQFNINWNWISFKSSTLVECGVCSQYVPGQEQYRAGVV